MEEKNQQLSSTLRELCDNNGKEKNPAQSAEILYQMGMVYKTMSENCTDKHEQKITYIRCAVLLNAAIARDPKNTEDIKLERLKLCNQILKLAKAEKYESNLVKKSEEVLYKFKYLRDKVGSSLQEIKSTQKIDQNLKVKYIEEIQNKITSEYKAIMHDIMEYCVLVQGTPPCEYALVAMGSLARNEITPYSDFEHAYVLENNVQKRSDYEEILDYFRWVSVIFHVIVINLGETIVPNVSLPHVNDQICKENDWFFDKYTPRGISFDGMMPHASKFPLGRSKTKNKEWKTELIKPVSEMLKYLESKEAVKNGYRLAEVLVNTCFVSGSVGVYNAYQNGITECTSNSLDIQKLSSGLDEDFKNFSPFTTLPSFHRKQVFDVKRLIYRSTSLFVAALGQIHKIPMQSSFDIVRKLHEKDVITSAMMDAFLFALSLACEARLRVYLQHEGQYELVDLKVLVKILGEDNVVLYFEIVLQLHSLVRIACRGESDKTICSLDKFNKMTIFYWLKMYHNAIKEGVLLLKKLPQDDDDDPERMLCHRTQFFCFVKLKKFKDATEVYEKIFEVDPFYIDTSDAAMVYHEAAEHGLSDEKQIFIQKEIKLRKLILSKSKSFLEKHSLCVQLGGCLLECNQHKEALQYFEQAESLMHEGNIPKKAQLTLCQMGKAKCYFHLHDIEKAIQYFEVALLRLEMQLKRDANNNECKEDIASCHYGLGKSYFESKDYTQCFKHFTSASNLWDDLKSYTKLDLLATTLSTLGEDLMKQHNYCHLVTCFKLELNIRKHESIGSNDLNIKADRFFGMGCCFFKLGKMDEAFEWLKQAKEMLLSDNDKKVQEVARCDAMLGAASLALKEYENASRYSHACLEIISKTEVGYLAYCYFTIGQCLLHFNDPAEGLKALQNAKQFFKKQNNHTKIVECENLIDSCQTASHFVN